MTRCEVVEVRNLADAVLFACSNPAVGHCSDCGMEICDSHTESCGTCHAVFCPACLSLHLHRKAASVDQRMGRDRKTA